MIKFFKKIFKRKPKYTLYELGSMAADRNDFAAAFKCFVTDAKKNNNPQSQFLTGFFLYHGTGVKKNYEYALQWFELAAEQGNADAMFYIGEIYKNGKGVMKDINKAAVWYLKAAELDHTEAQFNIGFCYKNGKGVPKNDIEALRWLEPAGIHYCYV